MSLDFITPGCPVKNRFIQRFDGRLRYKGSSFHRFRAIAEAGTLVEAWREGFNFDRPHGGLRHSTHSEFAGQFEDMITAGPLRT